MMALYRPFDHWRFRAGFAYDPTPVPNAIRRTPRIPDHDRYWAALGLAYEVDAIRMDLGYAHVFSLNARSDNADPLTGHILHGYYAGAANLFGAQVTCRF